MTEGMKIELLLKAIARGIPPERVYRIVILPRVSVEATRGGEFLDQPGGIPSEHRER